MIARLITPLIITLLAAIPEVLAQRPQGNTSIICDALAFHGPDITEKEYVDIYVAIPYQAIQFQEYGGQYAAQVSVTIVLRDSAGVKRADTTVKRSRLESSYATTQGSTGASENVVVRYLVPPGSYRSDIIVKDLLSHRDRSVTDSIVVPDFQNTPALSSLLYVSQIEETNGRYSITPFIGQTIWSQDLSLFVFFEYYVQELHNTVTFEWYIADANGARLGGGFGSPVLIQKRTTQHFLPIRLGSKAPTGSYTLTVVAHPVQNGQLDTTVTLTSSNRGYRIPKSFSTTVMSDLTIAIKQLAYIATQTELDEINAAGSEADRLALFEDFWKRHDPSPNTVRNEAFEEYYGRVNTANKLYKSYADGWMTDMGRVYIVCGEPSSRDRIPSQYGSTQLERWYYTNKQTFVFEDTGFGDYRLRTPWPPDFKYHYR